jgi:hypothetical protein
MYSNLFTISDENTPNAMTSTALSALADTVHALYPPAPPVKAINKLKTPTEPKTQPAAKKAKTEDAKQPDHKRKKYIPWGDQAVKMAFFKKVEEHKAYLKTTVSTTQKMNLIADELKTHPLFLDCELSASSLAK